MELMGLPVVMIENILSYLSYDEIAKNRIVSRSLNEICMKMLNRGFLMIERRHAHALKNVKAQLPRRESERRYHQLSRHCDILTSIETRISMLNMTYSKFIDQGLCCFIPGKVIDEIRRVLSIVETMSTPPRAHEVLQELRDISSMAIEHFDDKISAAFRRRLQEGAHPPPRHQTASVLVPLVVKQEMIRLRRRTVLNAKLSLFLASQFRKCVKRMTEYKKMTTQQNNTIRVMAKKQREQDTTIADLKKRIEECDIKYSELTHTNQAVGGASKSSESSGQLRHFSSQIKLDLSELPIGTSRKNAHKSLPNMQPRKPVIRLPSLSETEDEPPPKMAKINLPSTSGPKTRTQTALAKIKTYTNEIKHLSNLSKEYDDLAANFEIPKSCGKRPSPMLSADVHIDCKKIKKD